MEGFYENEAAQASIESSFVLHRVSFFWLGWWKWLFSFRIIACKRSFVSPLCFFIAAQVEAIPGSIVLAFDGVKKVQNLEDQPQGNGFAIPRFTMLKHQDVGELS